jgi:glyoxylase-like metal-dependent hydrolase (beta-lactamase superfamily II)
MPTNIHRLAALSTLAFLSSVAVSASAQPAAAKRLLESAAEAMGGMERLQRVENFALTGFGQQLYFDGGGNVTGDVNAPPKWRGVADAQRSFDLRNERAVYQERWAFMFPFAAPFGNSWPRNSVLQTGGDMLDHPLPALLEALDSETTLGAVTIESGDPVVQFTTDGGAAIWIAFDPATHLPKWTRRVVPHQNLGEVAVTAYFTGYAAFSGVQLPLGLMNRIDWRDQITLMFQVDSYRVDLPANQLPAFPAPAQRGAGAAPTATVTALGKGVWDVRTGTNGGPVIEFDDHLVMFEAGGGPAPTLARIDAANALVRGKQVTAVIVSHHHFDHTAGLRAAVSRGLRVISHRGNEGIIREMIERPASVYPDDLARSPHPLEFVPVDEHLTLQDDTQRLDIYRVLNHTHMANGVLAYLPEQRILMEGDLGDEAWTWHWWAGAMKTNLEAYNLEPLKNVAVHGPPGGLSIEDTLANTQKQAEAAQKFCSDQVAKAVFAFGCPVQYDTSGALPLAPR